MNALRSFYAGVALPGVRVAAWVRGERPNSRSRGPQNGWEPVVFAGGRLYIGGAA